MCSKFCHCSAFSCIKFHEKLICTVLTVIPYLFFTMTLLVTPDVPLMKSNTCFARESPTMINSGDPHSGPWICNNHFPWVKFVFQNFALFFKHSHAVKILICCTETACSSLSCFSPQNIHLLSRIKESMWFFMDWLPFLWSNSGCFYNSLDATCFRCNWNISMTEGSWDMDLPLCVRLADLYWRTTHPILLMLWKINGPYMRVERNTWTVAKAIANNDFGMHSTYIRGCHYWLYLEGIPSLHPFWE